MRMRQAPLASVNRKLEVSSHSDGSIDADWASGFVCTGYWIPTPQFCGILGKLKLSQGNFILAINFYIIVLVLRKFISANFWKNQIYLLSPEIFFHLRDCIIIVGFFFIDPQL